MKAILIDGKEIEVNPAEIFDTSYGINGGIIINVGKKGKSVCYICRCLIADNVEDKNRNYGNE